MSKGPEKSEVSRRHFLKTGVGTTAAGIAALSGFAEIVPPRVLGANDRVRVAVIGLHGRGQDHIHELSGLQNVEIAALCDAYEPLISQRQAQIEKRGRPRPKGYQDLRKLFDDKSIDAVTIATPNHWHALMGIWACQAGKDVYVEKPCAHNLWEGRQLARAAQRYNRMVQHGTQIRSAVAIRNAMDKLHSGVIGDVYMARGLCYKWRDTIGHAPPSDVPQGLDYNLWQGPAPEHVFTKNRFLYNWHWFWWYGNGDIGNQGVHQIDVARWGLGVKFPNKISAIGGHFMFDDDQQTPNTLSCAFEYEIPNAKPKMIEFEVRHWITNNEAEIGTPELGTPAPRQAANGPKLGPLSGSRNTVGDIFYGSKGCMSMGDEDADTYKTWLGKDMEPGPTEHQGGSHFGNFIDCVRSRRAQDLHAPIEEGFISAGLMQLANVSYRLGRTIHFDPDGLQAIGDDDANHLLRDGDRGYRAPFVVPENV
ncbi:MAG: gfo/Idh/MocA family oxidoreductase [Acidobacteria bacterium]|nr:MAG: gfo/Idh/MocA family oxidoreductase [Acidobacteriota bacterium]